VTWLGPLPFDVPGLPGLSGAILLWGIPFLASAIFVLPLTARAWLAWLRIRSVPDADAERVYALGEAIARSCGLLMVAAGLGAGLLAATVPPILPRRRVSTGGEAVILVLVLLAVLVTVQSVALHLRHKAAAAILARSHARNGP